MAQLLGGRFQTVLTALASAALASWRRRWPGVTATRIDAPQRIR
ncbi:hypothetical protein [Pseudooceanicola sp.]|nr:hypothetical protein [Pseudooceanicola sp.]MDF1855175.1 hypothetical protein [Pseudooceanicola sp.]